MSETLLKVEITFLGESEKEEFLGKLNYEKDMFEFYKEGEVRSNGFIPFSAIKKLKIVGGQEIETPYNLSMKDENKESKEQSFYER